MKARIALAQVYGKESRMLYWYAGAASCHFRVICFPRKVMQLCTTTFKLQIKMPIPFAEDHVFVIYEKHWIPVVSMFYCAVDEVRSSGTLFCHG